MLVPMLIAAVIILNAMLGAVAERTNEIHVYTSIGLAPVHVGMLFLAEAAALGTIGVVSGYIFGRAWRPCSPGRTCCPAWISTIPRSRRSSRWAWSWAGDALGAVAGRAASRSPLRRWNAAGNFPSHRRRAVGRASLHRQRNRRQRRRAFIDEFLVTTTPDRRPLHRRIHQAAARSQQHLHASDPRPDGAHLAGPLRPGRDPANPAGDPPHAEHSIFDVHLELTREAGNPATWRRLNRRFLVDIRKQFLLWRTLAPGQVQNYLDKSAAFFATAPQRCPPPE